MLFTGYKKRSIADQTGVIDFRFSLSFDNTTGECIVGLSGTRDFRFEFKSGKIYDTVGNFVQSYSPQVPVEISGQLGQTTYDYAINNELIAMGVPVNTGKYSWLYIRPSGTNVEFDGFVRGTLPNYYLDNAGKYFYQNYEVTGRIINLTPSNSLRIFDVQVLQSSSPFLVSDFTTGDISNTGYIKLTSDQIGLSDYVVPLLLKTNFGDVSLDFTITGDYTVIPDVYLNISPDTVNVVNEVAKDYLVQFAYFPTGAYLGVSLEYVSGTTGNIYFFKDQVSDLQYRLLSGVIVGCERLSAQHTGLVSGLDPKTNIWELGTGTGLFTAPNICATGTVTEDYTLKVFGNGEGFFNINYLASGAHSGLFSGVVPIQGGWLTIVGYNFTGTGDTPGVAVGFVPTGTGRYFARPTGCLTISQTLNYDADYYSGTLSVQKAYEGPLTTTYSVLSVGFATGQMVSGRVDSSYVLNFEQGLYTYTKYYSGLVSGHATNTGNFEPTGCISDETPVTGIVTGYFSITAMLDCSATTGLPMIPITGYPVLVYDSQRRLVQPNKVVLIRPSGGWGTEETSYNAVNGVYTRTKTSRMGATPSGDGYFQNPVGDCLDDSVTGRLWKESLPYSVFTGSFDSSGNSLGYASTRMYMRGSGDLEADTAGALDSGVIHFYISGEGTKAIAFRGLNLGNSDRILRMVLFKNGVFLDSWEDFSVQPGLFQYADQAAEGTDVYDTIGLSDLSSGRYSLYVSSREAPLPYVFFKTGYFSGCEQSRNLIVTVVGSGVFRGAACVNMVNYEEITAHSGVNYDPIYLQYNDTGLAQTGCYGVSPRGMRCPGICFSAGSPTGEEYRWGEEVREYTFTIPIYDNANYSSGHQFKISLSEPSGCNLYSPSEATIHIIDNDYVMFVTGGALGYETGAMLPDSLDCSYIEPRPPEPPDPCVYDPWLCDPCAINPSLCDPGNPPPLPSGCTGITLNPCCNCSSVTLIQGTCPGYGSEIFSGLIPTPGSVCGQTNVDGCGPTNGYIYAGKVCCSGSSLQTRFAGNCMNHTFMAYPEDCITNPETCQDAGDIDWSGCSNTTNCTGNCDGMGNCDNTGTFNCTDFARRDGRRRRPKTPKCPNLLLFLKVTEDTTCSPSSSCREWHWTGMCVAPRGGFMGLVCPPAP